jgi:hypothetical protein
MHGYSDSFGRMQARLFFEVSAVRECGATLLSPMRAETTADSLLVSARLNAERANRPGCAPQEEGLDSGKRR